MEAENNEGIKIPGEKSPNEVIAMEKGWRPKEEYDGDPDNWVDADEFLKRQPLFDKIKNQSRRLKELEKTIEGLSKHYNMSIQQAKAKAVSELQAQRNEAIELGEVEKVHQIDKRIDEVKAVPDPVAAKPALPMEIENFVEEQKDWFNKDKDMTAFAVAFNESYLKNNPGDLETSLKKTLEATKKAFPEHFANKRKQTPPPVDGGSSTPAATGGSKYKLSQLNKEQKLVYDQLVVRHKQMSHDDYFKSLDEAGYLGN